MRPISRSVVLLALLLATATLAGADVYFPTVTKIFFTKHGKPYREPASFTVRCYGYFGPDFEEERAPGTYTPEEVFRFSAKCPRDRCEITEPFYLNHRRIAYCDMEGKAGGKPFKLPRYAKSPIDFNTCVDARPELRRCTLNVALPD